MSKQDIKLRFSLTLHSKGGWTLKGDAIIEGRYKISASIPQGVSKGEREVVYLPEKKAIENCKDLAPYLKEYLSKTQREWDEFLISKDNTNNKSALGGNTILLLSLLFAKTKAFLQSQELFEYLCTEFSCKKPVFPRIGWLVFEGGKHGSGGPEWQEFIFSLQETVPSLTIETLQKLDKKLEAELKTRYPLSSGNFGLEGGRVVQEKDPFLLIQLIEKIADGIEGGVFLDIAGSELYRQEGYLWQGEYIHKERWQEIVLKTAELGSVIAIEDPFDQNDKESWQRCRQEKKGALFIGDDLTTTNITSIREAVGLGLIDGVVIKPNQIGTITETMDAMELGKGLSLVRVVKHRSCETTDNFIVDIAIAGGAEFLMIGGLKGGERISKYNRLLEIESLLS